MNRIYQGRVTKVEIPAPAQQAAERGKKATATQWQTLGNGHEALWQHHELFQDAVVVIG